MQRRRPYFAAGQVARRRRLKEGCGGEIEKILAGDLREFGDVRKGELRRWMEAPQPPSLGTLKRAAVARSEREISRESRKQNLPGNGVSKRSGTQKGARGVGGNSVAASCRSAAWNLHRRMRDSMHGTAFGSATTESSGRASSTEPCVGGEDKTTIDGRDQTQALSLVACSMYIGGFGDVGDQVPVPHVMSNRLWNMDWWLLWRVSKSFASERLCLMSSNQIWWARN